MYVYIHVCEQERVGRLRSVWINSKIIRFLRRVVVIINVGYLHISACVSVGGKGMEGGAGGRYNYSLVGNAEVVD
jgi:hypothetical protein